MKKIIKIVGLICFLGLIINLSTIRTVAASSNNQPLISDLSYNKDRQVITGKTAPNANVWLDNVAGAVVANDKGEFEFPVPSNTKQSVITVLDAEGDKSTDVRFNFEKNTIETSETKTDKESAGATTERAVASSKKSDESTNATSQKNSSNSTTTDTTATTTSTTTTTSDTNAKISEASYKAPKTPKKSLIWLWMLLGLIAFALICVGLYLWYLKKVKAEEKLAAKKRYSKKNRKHQTKTVKKSKKRVNEAYEDDYLDQLIDSEMKSAKTKSSPRSKNRDKTVSKRRKTSKGNSSRRK